MPVSVLVYMSNLIMKLNISNAFYQYFSFSSKIIIYQKRFQEIHTFLIFSKKKNSFVSFKILQELKTDILNYTPVNENVSSANILLIGQIGAGKSSVLNSVNSIYRGKITSRALCGSFEHSLTTTISPHCLSACYFVL